MREGSGRRLPPPSPRDGAEQRARCSVTIDATISNLELPRQGAESALAYVELVIAKQRASRAWHVARTICPPALAGRRGRAVRRLQGQSLLSDPT